MEQVLVLFTIVFLVFVDKGCAQNLEVRMDNLERYVGKETFRMKSDIVQLEQRILDMNLTKSAATQDSINTSEVNVKIKDIDTKLEKFITVQNQRSAAMAKAISDEKAIIRKILNVTKELAGSNEQSVIEIEETISLNEAEIQNFRTEMEQFKTIIVGELDAVKNLTKLLDERIVDMGGTIVIQGNPKPPPCPVAWFRNEDTCYLYDKQDKLNWFGASIRCHDFGGKLAEPDTEREMKYILEKIDGRNAWLGASDDEDEGSWVWSSSQKPVEFAVWQSGQPNNLFGRQNCLEIGLSKLNDENCFNENTYVCEKPVSK